MIRIGLAVHLPLPASPDPHRWGSIKKTKTSKRPRSLTWRKSFSAISWILPHTTSFEYGCRARRGRPVSVCKGGESRLAWDERRTWISSVNFSATSSLLTELVPLALPADVVGPFIYRDFKRHRSRLLWPKKEKKKKRKREKIYTCFKAIRSEAGVLDMVILYVAWVVSVCVCVKQDVYGVARPWCWISQMMQLTQLFFTPDTNRVLPSAHSFPAPVTP